MSKNKIDKELNFITMIIYYFRRQNYGNIHFYAAKAAHRDAFRCLTGKKTLDVDQMELMAKTFNLKFEEILENDSRVER